MRAKIRDCEHVGVGEGTWGSRAPCLVWQALASAFSCLRPKPGFIPGDLGGKSCQSQFHHLGANLPLPPPPSPPLPALLGTPEKGDPLTPRPALILPPQALGSGPTEVCRQALTQHARVSQAQALLSRPPLRFCFSLPPDALPAPEPEPEPESLHRSNTLLLWLRISQMILGLSVRPDCSFVGEANLDVTGVREALL